MIKEIKSRISDILTQEKDPTKKNFYKLIGKKEGISKLVDRFYFFMDTLEDAKECRALHGKDLSNSAYKLTLFLTGWFGGPNDFVEKFGHPMMRKRHFPFRIGALEKNQWLLCMENALDEKGFSQNDKSFMMKSFISLADRIQNTD